MKLLLQTLKFFWDHMFVLSGVCLLYLVPDYLLMKYFVHAYPGVLTGTQQGLALAFVLVLLLFVSLRQAALVYVVNVKHLGHSETLREILLGTIRAGLLYYWPLWVANIVRVILMAVVVAGAHFLAGSFSSVSGDARFGIFLGTALAGTVYIFTRLAYFDFLIVLKEKSALDALRLSFKQTTGNWSLFFSVTAITVVLAYFIVQEHSITLVNEWIGDFRRAFLQMLLICLVQVLCFMHFRDLNLEKVEADKSPDSKLAQTKKRSRKLSA